MRLTSDKPSRGYEAKLLDSEKEQLEAALRKHGFSDFKLFNAEEIMVSEWVRMKCMFGCSNYGKNGCCPPNVPPVAECREFFGNYLTAVSIRSEKAVEKPEKRFD